MLFLVVTGFFIVQLYLGDKRPFSRYRVFLLRPSHHVINLAPRQQGVYLIYIQVKHITLRFLELFCSKMQIPFVVKFFCYKDLLKPLYCFFILQRFFVPIFIQVYFSPELFNVGLFITYISFTSPFLASDDESIFQSRMTSQFYYCLV